MTSGLLGTGTGRGSLVRVVVRREASSSARKDAALLLVVVLPLVRLSGILFVVPLAVGMSLSNEGAVLVTLVVMPLAVRSEVVDSASIGMAMGDMVTGWYEQQLWKRQSGRNVIGNWKSQLI